MQQYKSITNIKDLIPKYDVFLFDIWGVIFKDLEYIYEGVVDSINKVMREKTVYFITNNPQLSKHSYEILKKVGVNVKLNMIFSSGDIVNIAFKNNILKQFTNHNFNEDCKPTVYHLGGENNQDLIEGADIEVTSDINSANILLLSINIKNDESYIDNILHNAIKRNLPLICANPDTIFIESNKITHNAGYFSAKYEKLGGTVSYYGKPHKNIYYYLFDKTNINPKNHKILMIGDTFRTDILGARNVGINSALVLTGNTRAFFNSQDTTQNILRSIEKQANKESIWPDYILQI